jgi:predicted nuclease of predicted toxin-antitoxin system
MKFLLNMNIPRNLGIKLMQNGCEYRHVSDIGMFS